MTCQESQHTVLMHMARHTNWNVLSHHLLFFCWFLYSFSCLKDLSIRISNNCLERKCLRNIRKPQNPLPRYSIHIAYKKGVILRVNVGKWCIGTMEYLGVSFSGFWLANRPGRIDWFGHQFTTGHGGGWSLSLVNNSNGAVDNGLTNVNNDRWKMMAYKRVDRAYSWVDSG